MGARESKVDRSRVWALRSRRVVTPSGERDAVIVVTGETIESVVEPREAPSSVPFLDLGDRVVLPGLIDTHVHINEPGRTEWEGFATATRAAAAGGITTLVDMPLNSSPVTVSVDALERKRAAARGQIAVDVGFYGGIVPGAVDQVAAMSEAGVLGFKAFLCPSGIDEFPAASPADLARPYRRSRRRACRCWFTPSFPTTSTPRSSRPSRPTSGAMHGIWTHGRGPGSTRLSRC